MDLQEDVLEFEKLEEQLHSFLREVAELSRKKPNDGVNKFKLSFINSNIAKLNRLLKGFRPLDDFEQFSVAEIPTNSDVVLILSQYASAVLRLRASCSQRNALDHEWYWTVKGKQSKLVAGNPSQFRYHPK